MHLTAIPYLHGIDFVVCETLVNELIWPARRSVVQGQNTKLGSADLTLNERVEGWELLAVGKMLRNILIPLHHHLGIFFHFDFHAFLYFVFLCTDTAQMLHNLRFEITNLKQVVVSALDQLNLIISVVSVSECTVLYGAYNCQGLARQVSKFILSVSVRVVIIVSRICDQCSHGKKTSFNSRPTMHKRIIVTTGLSRNANASC